MRNNNFLNRLAYQLKDFYGWDKLSKYSFIAGAICLAIKYFTLVGVALIGYSIWRGFSKNRYKRYEELQAFNNVLQSLKYKFNPKGIKSSIDNTINYKVFTCPACAQKLRVPRKKGNITITCRKCRNQFKGKS